jgi:hypothetical protein
VTREALQRWDAELTPLVPDSPANLEKAVAGLAFWRRVLLKVHGAALGPEPARSDSLLRYLTS